MRRTILSARTACNEATKHLGEHADDLNAWVEDALADTSPFAFEDIAATPPGTPPESPKPSPQEHRPAQRTSPRGKPKKLLTDAARECIDEYVSKDVWSSNTVRQVETATQLFDFACGGDVMIEYLTQEHVTKFYELCAATPNRWGKTRAEREHGIAASLRYAEQLERNKKADKLGFSQETLNKQSVGAAVAANRENPRRTAAGAPSGSAAVRLAPWSRCRPMRSCGLGFTDRPHHIIYSPQGE